MSNDKSCKFLDYNQWYLNNYRIYLLHEKLWSNDREGKQKGHNGYLLHFVGFFFQGTVALLWRKKCRRWQSPPFLSELWAVVVYNKIKKKEKWFQNMLGKTWNPSEGVEDMSATTVSWLPIGLSHLLVSYSFMEVQAEIIYPLVSMPHLQGDWKPNSLTSLLIPAQNTSVCTILWNLTHLG